MVEDYSFNHRNVAERHLTALRTGELNSNQTKFLLDFYTEAYNNSDIDFTRSDFQDISKWIKQTGTPEMDWKYMKEHLEDYVADYIREYNLESQSEELAEPGSFNEDYVVFIPRIDIGKKDYEDMEPVEMPEEPWLTQQIQAGYRTTDGLKCSDKFLFYHDEESAKEHVEMLCNSVDTENLETAEQLIREAVLKEEYDIALSFAEIVSDYAPNKIDNLIQTELADNHRFLEELEDLSTEADEKADRLADFIDEKTNEDFHS